MLYPQLVVACMHRLSQACETARLGIAGRLARERRRRAVACAATAVAPFSGWNFAAERLSRREQQAVVNLDSDDDSDDSSLSDIRRDVRELQQELGMEPQEPLLSDDESEDDDIYGAPQQRPTVRFEDSADPSPTQDPPTQDTSPSHTRRGTQYGRRANPMFRSINSRLFSHVRRINDVKNLAHATLNWETVTQDSLHKRFHEIFMFYVGRSPKGNWHL